MKRQTRRMKDLAKRGLVGLLTVSMCLSNVQGIAFADNRVEVGGVKVDGKKVTLNLNGGSLMEAARAALADANVYDDTYIAVSKDAKTQAAYRALTDGSNPLYELALFSDGELQALEDAGVEIVALIQMDQKQAEAAGNLMPATASEIERSSTKVEFFDPSKDEGKEILLYQPDSLFAGFYDQFSNQLMNASEKEIVSADPSTYELSGDEKVTFLFINHADAGRTFNLELNGESLEKGIKVAKAESVIKGVMSTLDVSGIDETLETPAPETTAAAETDVAATEPSTEAAVQPSDEAATEPSTETAIEPSTEASGNAGESTVILPETGATAESDDIETSAAAETSAAVAQPTEAEANAETGLPTEGQTATENTEQPAAEKTAAAAENTGIVDTVKEVIETIAENANATMMKIERRLGVIRAEAAESDEAVVEAQKADEAPKAENADEAPKSEENPAAGTENEAPKPEENLAAGSENEAPKSEENLAAGTENEAPKSEENPAAGSENEAPKPEENPAAGTGIETPNPEETPAEDTGIEVPKTEETTAAAAIETTAAVKTDMDIALENDRKALLRETRAADLVDSSVASARVLQYTLDDLSKSFWSAEITDRYEVNVFAEDNAFTETVKLELRELAKPEEAEDGSLAVNEDTLSEKQVEALKADGVYENSQSLDIRFVNAAGEEVEPSSAVKVRIKVYKEALPEDADISTMAIRHLDEKSTDAVNVDTVAEYREDATSDHGTIKPVDGDGKVTELQTVDAENADTEAATIAETQAESKKVLPEEAVAVESTFTVNSFSSFTITFGTNNESAKVIFVDANHNEIGTNAIINLSTISADKTSELDLSKYAADYVKKTDGWYEWWEKQNYTFNHVELRHGSELINPIDNKLKVIVITDESGKSVEKKWQYTYTTTTEGSEEKNVVKGSIEKNDTIYVVYDHERKLTPVETVDSASKGFKLYMTDFTKDSRFTSGGYKQKDGSLTQGLYSPVVAKDGFPKLVNERQSLSKWCGTTTEVNKLFIKSVYDETGYFYYNSAEWFATRASRQDNQTRINTDFTVYNQLGSPSEEDLFYYKRGNFLPFNTLNTSKILTNRNLFDDTGAKLKETDPRYNETLYGLNEAVNFYFGLYGVADFYQPVGGQVNGEDMIFEFTGDDDMVVYIDGVLVLDLGGIHDAQSGSINFATGEVKYTNRKQGETLTWHKHTIHDKFAATNQLGSTRWKGDTTFADGTQHKIQIFYMERGAGASNLKIKVNIPPIPDGSVNITKTVDGLDLTQAAEEEYTLKLLMDGNAAVKQPFTRIGVTGPTDSTESDGTFKIKAGETVNFAGIASGTNIEVQEVDKGQIYQVTYESYDSTGQKSDKNNATVISAGYVNVTVKNNAKESTKSLTITKKFLVNGSPATVAPEETKFNEATFTLQEKNYGADDASFKDLHTIKYEAFDNGSYIFTELDPRKVYRVIENISAATPETNGGTGETPYAKTTSVVGKSATSAEGTTSGEIALGTMGLDGKFSGFFDNTVTFTNEYKSRKANIQFTKVDAGDTAKKLKDAEFTLYFDSEATNAFHREGSTDYVTATSNDDGVVEFTDLPYNATSGTTYYIKETKAPDGYVTNGTIYAATIAADGTVSMTGDGKVDMMTIIKNTPIETELTFYKKSKTTVGTDISLDRAVFEIKRWVDGQYQLLPEITGVGSDGRFTIPTNGIKLTHLPDGTYQLTEITAPAGYNLLADPISFVIENGQLKQPKTASEVVKLDSANKTVTIYNTAGIALPETGGMGTLMTTMSGMALMLIALGYLILVKRREKGGLN